MKTNGAANTANDNARLGKIISAKVKKKIISKNVFMFFQFTYSPVLLLIPRGKKTNKESREKAFTNIRPRKIFSTPRVKSEHST